MSASRRDLALLTLGCAVLFGLRLGARDLWNPNEPIYGEAVAEMAQRGDWLLPWVNGVVFAEKPILFYWLALSASKLLGGVSELSLRLPSFAAGIATVLGAYVLVAPYAGRARALASAACCATLFGVFWNARFVQMDILVTAATVWCVAMATRVLDHGAPAWSGFMIAGACAGLGFAAKGPVGWLCPGLTIAGYAAVTGRARGLLRREAAAGALACLAVSSPWYLMLLHAGRTDVLGEVLLRQNVQRFISPWDHEAPWWYYLGYFWVDMAPWALLVPLTLGQKRERPDESRLAWLAWIWIAAVVGFFSFSRSKRSPYLLPIAPAVAVLAAEAALAFLTGRLDAARKRWFGVITAFLTGVLIAGGAFVLVGALVRLDKPTALPVAFLGLVASAAGGLIALDLLRQRTRPVVPLTLGLAALAFYLAAAGVTLPALNVYKSARPFCAQVAGLVRPGDEVASFSFWSWRAEYRYYLGMPIANLAGEGALREAWNGPTRLVLLVEATQLANARRVIGDAVPAASGRVGRGSIYVFTSR